MDQGLLQVSKILQEFTEEIQDGIVQDAKDVADEAVAKLKGEKSTYKIRTGKYNRGWKQKTTVGARYVHATIHNKEYQLTHLLEYGHATRNGGRTKSFPHIAPVEEFVEKEFTDRVKKTIEGGQ